MGIDPLTLGLLSLGVSGLSTAVGITQNQKARKQQENVQAEQNASNRTQQLEEQRRQIREERVKRARVLQSSENSGVAGSSGETGAIGGMSTQLSANLGANAAAVQRASNISVFSQNAANASGRAALSSQLGSFASTAIKVGGNIFQPQTPDDPLGDFIKERNL